MTALTKLDEKLKDLDGNALRLANMFSDMSIHSWHEQSLSRVISSLEEAQQYADKFPVKGRLTEYFRLWLAMDVAKAIKSELEVTPTSTENGLYISVLEIVLGYATGREPLKVSDLAKRALNELT